MQRLPATDIIIIRSNRLTFPQHNHIDSFIIFSSPLHHNDLVLLPSLVRCSFRPSLLNHHFTASKVLEDLKALHSQPTKDRLIRRPLKDAREHIEQNEECDGQRNGHRRYGLNLKTSC